MDGLDYGEVARRLLEAAKADPDPERRLTLHWSAFQIEEQLGGRGHDRPLRYPETCRLFMALHAALEARGEGGDVS